ncbi:1006_t:CDS:2 [Paraglomus brasilianum]|uniref:Peptidyl-prolyl cis-trans isomerase n=1 Tax=Paraglomus brasilianum TaxID=144538 RepID=A0A9N8YX14_9GLOM|nr:1006_t:CDS:2 [Paraglomus brasilianum]
MIQTGDPTATGKGGESIFGILHGPQRRYFPAEVHPKLKHKKKGTVSMAVASDGREGGGVSGSQFFITTADNLDYLDGKYTVFGEVAEGFDTLETVNDAYCDESGRPYKDIRIKHTIILDDPFPDPEGLVVPDESPKPSKEMLETIRIAEDESIEPELPPEELEKMQRRKEAEAQALTLEMIGDIPFAEVKPPENVLFVCKLNPVTRDEDMELIFSRFGPISSCEVIRDKKTGDSLCYAFIEFENKEDCETAYFKMNNVLIDDRRIKVDFSQSVSKLHRDWVVSKMKKLRGASGYGGSQNLERKSRYRDEKEETEEKYDMVFNHVGDYESELRKRHADEKDGERYHGKAYDIDLDKRSNRMSDTSKDRDKIQSRRRDDRPAKYSSRRSSQGNYQGSEGEIDGRYECEIGDRVC